MGVTKKYTSDDILHESYKAIISLLCKKNVSPNQLELVKDHFKSDIDSTRRYELTKTLEELIFVLERRNVIGVFNVAKLFVVADKLNFDRSIGLLLNKHSQLLSKRYVPTSTFHDINLLTDFVPTLPDSVVDHISSNIRSSWQLFARALIIVRECDIDFIEDNFKTTEEQTKQVLEKYLHEAKLQRLGCPYAILLSALEKIKRRDLKDQVEEMLNEDL